MHRSIHTLFLAFAGWALASFPLVLTVIPFGGLVRGAVELTL
ncbi:hypothetical protein [Pseudoxanthomonas sp. UTMC 1351]